MSKPANWVGDREKAILIGPAGMKLAVRYGSEAIGLGDIIERISNGDRGDDLPILMADLGCDYDEACSAVFGGDSAKALTLLQDRKPQSHSPIERPRQ